MMQTPAEPAASSPADLPPPTFDEFGRWCVTQAEYGAVMAQHAEFLASVNRRNLHLRASFRGARFHGIDLTAQGKIASAKLVDFREAHFRECTFGDLDLAEADFSGASLLGADLSHTQNLAEYRLGATDLIYARVPQMETLAGLGPLREHAARAEKTLYLLVATSAVLITVSLSVRGVTLLRAGGSLTLPTIGIAVPVVLFYRMAPWLLLVLDAAFVSSLTKIWRSLRDLPAVLPSGRFVHREVMSYPNFSLLAVKYWPHLDTSRDETRWERRFVALSSWALVPAALLVVFLTYLSRHDELTTASHVAALVMSVALSLAGYGRMQAHLRRGIQQPRSAVPLVPRRWPARLRAADWMIYWPPEEARLPTAADPPTDRPEGDRGTGGQRPLADAGPRLRMVNIELVCLALTVALALVSSVAMRADGCSRALSRTAANQWQCHALAITAKDAELDSLHLDGINLRRAYLPDAHLVRTDLSDARLQGAYLHAASMDHVKLKDALLNDAILWEAHMDSATLRQADLRGADLRGAHLANARLQGADLRGADLTGATLDGAVLCGASIRPGRVGSRDDPWTPSSNRTCGFPASGFPGRFTGRLSGSCARATAASDRVVWSESRSSSSPPVGGRRAGSYA